MFPFQRLGSPETWLSPMANFLFAIVMQTRRFGTSGARDVRQVVLDVGRFLQAHQKWKSDSASTEAEEHSWLSPRNSLLFYTSRSRLRQKLLEKHVPWLDAAPAIDPSEATIKS